MLDSQHFLLIAVFELSRLLFTVFTDWEARNHCFHLPIHELCRKLRSSFLEHQGSTYPPPYAATLGSLSNLNVCRVIVLLPTESVASKCQPFPGHVRG